MTTSDRLARAKTDIDEVYVAGRQKANHAFWDNVPNYLNMYNYAGSAWNYNTFYPIPTTGSPTRSLHPMYSGVTHIFYAHGQAGSATIPYDLTQRLEDCNAELNLTTATVGSYFFYNSVFTRLPVLDWSSASKLDYCCAECKYLETVDKMIVSERCSYSNTFNNNPKLANITFDGVIGKNISFANSPLLTTESVQSIIDHLKDLTGATAQVVSFHSDVLDKLTEEQIATIMAKNWTF